VQRDFRPKRRGKWLVLQNYTVFFDRFFEKFAFNEAVLEK